MITGVCSSLFIIDTIEGANAAWMLGNWQTLEEFLEVSKEED
jgi:hypothetical protein